MGRSVYDEEDERFKADKYQLRDLLAGIILCFFGGFMLLKNMQVYSFGFARWFGDASAGIMIVAFIACFMVMVIWTNYFTKVLCLLSVIAIIINVILGTQIVFRRISMIELIIMIMLFFGGLAFILKVLLVPKSKHRRSAQPQGIDGAAGADDVDKELEEIKKKYK